MEGFVGNDVRNSTDTAEERTNTLSFDERVIKKITGFSTGGIPGVLAMSGNFISGLTDKLRSSDDPTKGISVEMGKKQVAISMKIICEYGRNIPAIFNEIVEKASTAIREMTGLEVVEVRVHVYDILTKEEFERQSKRKMEMEEKEEMEVATEVIREQPME